MLLGSMLIQTLFLIWYLVDVGEGSSVLEEKEREDNFSFLINIIQLDNFV